MTTYRRQAMAMQGVASTRACHVVHANWPAGATSIRIPLTTGFAGGRRPKELPT